MESPFRSEEAAFRFLLITIGAFALIVVASWISTALGFLTFLGLSAAAVAVYLRQRGPVPAREHVEHLSAPGERRVLVVAPHAEVANTVVGWLTSQGHEASLVKDFVSARSEFDANPPDLLVTEVRLGEFNGLQLAIRAHVHSPTISTIVIGDDDIVLERDALAQQARYVKTPELSRVFSETACAVFS